MINKVVILGTLRLEGPFKDITGTIIDSYDVGPALMAEWSKVLPLTASCLSPLSMFDSQPQDEGDLEHLMMPFFHFGYLQQTIMRNMIMYHVLSKPEHEANILK